MCLRQMIVIRRLVRERRAAHRTLKWFLTSMKPEVRRQGGVLREATPTFRTREWLLSRMAPHVRDERRIGRKVL